MALPIYQMDMYQKTPPKVKHTDINQKSPNWFQQLENIISLQKNPTKSKNNIKTLEQTLAVLKSRSSNLPDRSVPKGPAHTQTYRHHSKISNLVLATGKVQKYAKKTQQNLKKILKHLKNPTVLKNGSSNLGD